MSSPSNKRLRVNLRRLIDERGVSLRELERRSGGVISQACISLILMGQNHPTLTTLDELARLFDVTPAELIAPLRRKVPACP